MDDFRKGKRVRPPKKNKKGKFAESFSAFR
jgi:hypothetical protein